MVHHRCPLWAPACRPYLQAIEAKMTETTVTIDGVRSPLLGFDSLLYAGNNLGRAQEIFAKAVSHRPSIRLTIRQRTRVLQ
jgi:hypothetical protein